MDDLILLRSIDTNVLVRMLLRDDPRQVARVDALVAEGGLFVGLTVLVELEWVLRSVYKLSRTQVSELLTSLTAIEGLILQATPAIFWAIERHAAGADFADMVHLLAEGPETFITFDKRIANHAGETPPTPIETLA